jgi:hypothetical protein
MQARDKVHGPRSESEGMGEHRIESSPFCYLILILQMGKIFGLQLTSIL